MGPPSSQRHHRSVRACVRAERSDDSGVTLTRLSPEHWRSTRLLLGSLRRGDSGASFTRLMSYRVLTLHLSRCSTPYSSRSFNQCSILPVLTARSFSSLRQPFSKACHSRSSRMRRSEPFSRMASQRATRIPHHSMALFGLADVFAGAGRKAHILDCLHKRHLVCPLVCNHVLRTGEREVYN